MNLDTVILQAADVIASIFPIIFLFDKVTSLVPSAAKQLGAPSLSLHGWDVYFNLETSIFFPYMVIMAISGFVGPSYTISLSNTLKCWSTCSVATLI